PGHNPSTLSQQPASRGTPAIANRRRRVSTFNLTSRRTRRGACHTTVMSRRKNPTTSAARRTRTPKKDLPPLVNGDHLDQKTFHERYEAMPEVRAELIGGIVYIMSSPQRNRHGYHEFKLAG